jgi:hypothetical protein
MNSDKRWRTGERRRPVVELALERPARRCTQDSRMVLRRDD